MSHVDEGTLHAYLDGELPPVERERVETHLQACPACQARLAEERALIERASRLLGMAAPPERPVPPLQELRQRRPTWRLRRPLAWAATVIIALGLGWYARGSLLRRSEPATETEARREMVPAAPAAHTATTAPATRSEQESKDHASSERDADGERALARPRSTVNDALAAGRAAPAPRYGDSMKQDAAAAQPVAAQAAPVAGRAKAAAAPATAAVTNGVVVLDGAVQGRPVAWTAWPILARQAAHDVLGVDPVVIPGFAVRAYRKNPGGPEIAVEQVTDAGTAISLIERRADSTADRRADVTALNDQALAKTMNERLARFVGSLRVEIEGPLTPDSLSKLLELVAR